jgi:capsular exopolysaccharide synthesis family protein
VCVILGFVITTSYVLLKYLINTKLTTKKDIERMTSVPVIAEVFNQEEMVGKKLELNTRSVLSEQILNLRNNLKFILANINHSPVILFTSSVSGEGKTFLSSHLGNSLTYNNKRVILLELDLRKPKLSSSLGMSNSSGFSNYIIGVETLEQIIKKIPGTENLFIIPSGPIPPNPIELLENDKMNLLFSTLRERFDYIVIDTSPIGLVSDAKSLSPFIDSTFFVSRFNYTPKNKFKDMIEENADSDVFKKMGIIFNGINIKSSYSYYGYGYSKYSYGYGDKAPAKNKLPLTGFFKTLKERFT